MRITFVKSMIGRHDADRSVIPAKAGIQRVWTPAFAGVTFFLSLAPLAAIAADYTAGTGCPAAINHQPLPNLEYKAGESALGYAVAPAEDVPPILTADDFTEVALPLDIPVREYLDEDRYNLNIERMELRPGQVGQVTINAKTGNALFNNKSILTAEPTIMDPDCWK